MICPIFTAIEIIDDATAVFGTPTSPRPNYYRFHDLGHRLANLGNAGCPQELIDAIDDMIVGMIRNKSLMRWKGMGEPARAIHSQDAVDEFRAML